MIATDGQRYGPADIQTLQSWIQQGRILHQTVLEEEMGGARIAASAVGALQFGSPNPTAAPLTQSYTSQSSPYGTGYQPPSAPQQPDPYQQNPYASNYYRPSNHNSYISDPNIQQKMNNAWIGFALGLVCCAPFAIWGLICAIEAKKASHPQAQAAFICNIVALCLWGVGLLFNGLGLFAMFL